MPSTKSLTAASEEVRAALREKIGTILDDLDGAPKACAARTYDSPPVGGAAPEFTLPDAHGKARNLADLRGAGRVVLVFFRGNWCPYDKLQLDAFQAQLDELEADGAQLVAVSPQKPELLLAMSEERGYTFTILSDAGNAVADAYGVRVTLEGKDREVHAGVGVDLPGTCGDDSWSLPVGATFVIEGDGTISYADVSGDFRWRVGPQEVLAALKA